MTISKRLKNLELSSPHRTPCFCGKTSFLDLWTGKIDELTHCPKCREIYDFWAKLSAEAQKAENCTDESASETARVLVKENKLYEH